MSSVDNTRTNAFAPSEPERTDAAFDEFLAEVFGASERAGAIVGAAQVEDTLAQAIQGRLRDLDDAEIGTMFTGQAAPLHSFHAKIQMGFALALYDQAAREDLQVVKDIRNRFAHHISAKSFDDPIITKLCSRFHYPHHRVAIEERVFETEPPEAEETDARRRFQGVVGQLFFGLAMLAANPYRPSLPDRWRILEYDRRPDAPVPSQKKVRVRPSKLRLE